MSSITAILQIYRRSYTFKEQLEAIDAQTEKAEKIFIVHNEGDKKFEISDRDDIFYFYARPNQKFHLRFAIGLLAQTEYVSFFDDDTIPGKNWHRNCIKTIKKHDCLCGANGRNILPNFGQECPAGWGKANPEEVEVDFVGHAWFLRRRNLKYMWYDDKIYQPENGEDIQLSACLQIYGNIPTFVPPHPLSDVSLWGSDPVKARKYGSDEHSHWLVRKEHYQERAELTQYYKKKGWKLMYEK